jgi:hypothetical protein
MVRVKDNKSFSVETVGHWSEIKAPDGETDTVKVYGTSPTGTGLYVSSIKGHSYEAACSECRQVGCHKLDCSQRS